MAYQSRSIDTTTERPRQLPPDPGGLFGRDSELAVVRAALQAGGPVGAVVVVTGPAGVGKSALAVRAAHLVADEFTDGQVMVDLNGTDPGPRPHTPDEVVAAVLRGLGVRADDVPPTAEERTAAYRSVIAGRRILVLLDATTTAAQVRPLVAAGGCVTLVVTSRRRLTALAGARHVELRPLADDAAAGLLAAHAGVGRVMGDPAGTKALVRLCDGLPAALRVAGERLASRPELPLRLLAEHLATQPPSEWVVPGRAAPQPVAAAAVTPQPTRLRSAS